MDYGVAEWQTHQRDVWLIEFYYQGVWFFLSVTVLDDKPDLGFLSYKKCLISLRSASF